MPVRGSSTPSVGWEYVLGSFFDPRFQAFGLSPGAIHVEVLWTSLKN